MRIVLTARSSVAETRCHVVLLFLFLLAYTQLDARSRRGDIMTTFSVMSRALKAPQPYPERDEPMADRQ